MLSGLASTHCQTCGVDKREVRVLEPVLKRTSPTQHRSPREGPGGRVCVKISNDISRENSIKGGANNMAKSQPVIHDMVVNINKNKRHTRYGDF